MKVQVLGMLKETYEEECLHLELRMIRDAQEPRFEALKETHPEIFKDFEKARDVHTQLHKIRWSRVQVLTDIIEGEYDGN